MPEAVAERGLRTAVGEVLARVEVMLPAVRFRLGAPGGDQGADDQSALSMGRGA